MGSELATVDPAVLEQVEVLERDHESAISGAQATDLPTWFLGQEAALDGMEERLKEQTKIIQAQIDARRKALHYRWGEQFRAKVLDDLRQQGGKKKSVDYGLGKAGLRVKPEKFQILDGPALTAWCQENCMDALELKIARTGPIKDWIKSHGGELPPGCDLFEKREEFYPWVDHKALTAPVFEKEATDGE